MAPAADADASAETLKNRLSLRTTNCSPKRLDAAELKSLDSSIKKVTPFLKKVKERLGEEARAQLLAELARLNLSKYVDEVALGVAEAKLKLSDVPAATEVCSAMHVAYAAFMPALLPLLCKNATLLPPPAVKPGAPPVAAETDAERSARLFRKRATLRLLFELVAVGALDAAPVLSCFEEVIREDLPPNLRAEIVMPNLAVVASLSKHLLKDPLLIEVKARAETEGGGEGDGAAAGESPGESVPSTLSEREQGALRGHFRRYLEAGCGAWQEVYTHLRGVERANQKALSNKGELSDEATTAYDRARKAYERFATNCQSLSEAVEVALPDLVDLEAEEEAKRVDISMHSAREASMAEDELYDDLETRAFYEQLPDLRAELPAVLFGEDPDEANAPDKKGGAPAPAGSADVDALLKTLPQLSDKAAVDKLAADIVGRGGKSQRRAIVRALAAPPARRPELLPRYARLASILANCFKAVGTELLALLQEELEQLRNKMHKRGDAPDAPAALYLTAYLAEFVKFQLLGAGPVFSLLKTLLDSFSHGHVYILCALLEGCGKFLYARTESRQRCETMLSLLVKLRSAHRMPYELSALIDNAVYSTKPPDTSAVVVDDRPHVVRYIEFLLHRHLSKLTLEHCVRQLRKLPWQQPEIEAEVITALIDCASVKYHTIPLVACLVSALYRYHERAMLRVVDGAIERARCLVDRNDYREGQQRACVMKFVGELYNYKLMDSSMVFRMLSMILPPALGNWGHVMPLSHVAAHADLSHGVTPTARALITADEVMIDGPQDSMRLRCACALLDTCGQYFSKGTSKRRLDVFLVYLCRYLFCKALSADVEFMLSDTLSLLRPKLVRPATYAEACDAVSAMEARMAQDPRAGEALAHEILHTTALQRAEGGGIDAGSGYEDEGGEGGEGEEGEEGGEGEGGEGEGGEGDDEGDGADDELAEVERQLAELQAGDEEERRVEAEEEEEAVVLTSRERRAATREEEDEFEKEMQAMLSDAKKTPRSEPLPKPTLSIGSVLKGSAKAGGGALRPVAKPNAEERDVPAGMVALRVVRRGLKPNKLEADEVQVPVEDSLARVVIDRDEQANAERQRLKQQILAAAENHEGGGGGGEVNRGFGRSDVSSWRR